MPPPAAERIASSHRSRPGTPFGAGLFGLALIQRRTAKSRAGAGADDHASGRFDRDSERRRRDRRRRPGYLRRRIRRNAAIRRLAAADPLTKRTRRAVPRREVRRETRERDRTRATRFFFARRRALLRPPRLPLAFANAHWIAGVDCPSAKPLTGSRIVRFLLQLQANALFRHLRIHRCAPAVRILVRIGQPIRFLPIRMRCCSAHFHHLHSVRDREQLVGVFLN